MPIFKPTRILAFAALMLAAWPQAAAQARSPEIYTGIVTSTAVGGYDPVAYFTEGRPVEGKRDITWTWKGATWRFANEKNRDAFKAAPETYAPQYGGHCAWAVSSGYTAKGDPKHWKIVNGRPTSITMRRCRATGSVTFRAMSPRATRTGRRCSANNPDERAAPVNFLSARVGSRPQTLICGLRRG